MGDTRRRLSAALASLAIATTALGFVAAPATAAPSTTTTIETTPSPTPTPTASPTATAETPTSAATPAAEAPSQQAPVPAVEATTPPAPEATTAPEPAKLRTEAAAGGPTTTGRTLLAQLDISNALAPGYDRSYFNLWIDADGNGCDTRAEVLKAESLVPVTYSSGCTVATGQWYSWYDGATWTNASDVDIDHLVPLSEAWKSGASNWTADQRQAFANDLGYVHALEAVTGSVIRSKGDQDPATWMPTLDQCNYAID